MNKHKTDQGGFIPLILAVALIIIVVIVLVYVRVHHVSGIN
jgi:hypothetical protein